MTSSYPSVGIAAACVLLAACGNSDIGSPPAANVSIDVCAVVTEEDLDIIAAARRDKVAVASDMGGSNRCLWAEKEFGTSYFDIAIAPGDRDLRSLFPETLPSHVQLVEIRDVADGGYMTVTEDSIGNIAIRKGGLVLNSGVVFLDIEPGSPQHERLFEVFRRLLG